ncbi:MAG: DUF47 family protein, partial [Candidatus Methylarchaceae archaeon HK01B]|nr:DUF47 family protein [Candidatus Methylarchaceae archaeon HK01B]
MELRRFFSLKRREQEIFDFIHRHIGLTIAAVDHLKVLIEYLKMHEFDSLQRNYSEIDLLEKKADDVHRKIVEKISEGAFFGGMREDFLNILEKVNNIADSAKDSAKMLIVRRLEDEIINYIFEDEDFIRFFSYCLSAVVELKEVINGLEK